MAVNFSNDLVGLSLLTSSNQLTGTDTSVTFESKAVRIAKAQFTTVATTPPWNAAKSTTPLSAEVSTIKAMKTIIDKAGTGVDALPIDVQTSFTAYKALDRLQALAQSAASSTSSDAQRASLQTAFAKGLSDLETFLGQAPSDKVDLSFFQPARSVTSVALGAPEQYKVKGPGLVTARTDALPGLTGTEQFNITLTKPGGSDVVSVDLSQGPQPPTLDSVSTAINAAISAVPLHNPDGSIRLDANGQPVPRWLVRFVPERGTDKWGLTLNAPSGIEQVTLAQSNAKDALIVATGQTALDSPTATQVFRYDDPSGGMQKQAMATLSALDRLKTEQASLIGKTTAATTTFKTDAFGKTTATTTKSSTVYANTDAAAITTDPQGNSYVVGTTRGDLGADRSNGSDNLFLTKLDGEGKVVWQRSLGAAGSSSGAAISLTGTGDIVVAGTVNGSFDGATTDGDMLVARYKANGDESFATVIRSTGADTARAVAVGNDGSVFVGGKAATGGGDAFVARLDATGKVTERRTINAGGSEAINSLAIGGDGNLLALVNQGGVSQVRKFDAASLSTDLGTLSLGAADARVMAVAADGTIAVGGATLAALSGTQTNATSGGRDGFVARIDSGLGAASVTYLGSAGDDQVDSVTFMNGEIYAGGRTTGALAAPRKGAVDGFVARIDAGSGAIAATTQFGQTALRTEPVRLAASLQGATALGALGFAQGTVNPLASTRLTTQTALRPGDQFSIRVDDGAIKKITIAANDTAKSLVDRINAITLSKGTATIATSNGAQSLRLDSKAGHSIELIAGAAGSDALAKLGIEPRRIETPAALPSNAPSVRPGGSYGLALSQALNLSTAADAKAAFDKIKQALSMTQTAYRSLYWDDAKAKLAGGVTNTKTGTQSTVVEQAQLANYQAALTRLSSTPTSILGL